MGFDWESRKQGKMTPVGAMTFMFDDLHIRTLRLEGRELEADEYEAARKAFWQRKDDEERKKPFWLNWF